MRTYDDTEHTDEPICPHCGKKVSDAWEIDFGGCLDGVADHTCGSCSGEMRIIRHVVVTYTTRATSR